MLLKILLIISLYALGPLAAAKDFLACGEYGLFGRLKEGTDGYFYISTIAPPIAEIRVLGLPREQLSQAYSEIQFYNPKIFDNPHSDNSVIFIAWKKGHDILPRLIAKGKCERGFQYLSKAESP